jgi:hypothetical protein
MLFFSHYHLVINKNIKKYKICKNKLCKKYNIPMIPYNTFKCDNKCMCNLIYNN